ncbi:hypothetical protein C1886_20910 [Pseudomonas sp. FW300-N1A1]|uniref:hypothetical protein n=1 Tax=Pseudomonas sp. FW300-N1A1 TaxID=2075555 RepID=UPI000CD243B1|nr:hypothetical protein [Pseudomonas sp. FW300-N1A1]POA17619.1 hypothetical protein C1886_20910 [Pseudomonas sp. FW300-N1A1]
MATISVLAGDFLPGDANYQSGVFTLQSLLGRPVRIPVASFETLEAACVESVKNTRDAIGLGIAGAVLLGPIGAVAGYLIAGEETEVTVIATLKDGKKLLAVLKDDTFQEITARMPD